ncbi:MAG TPA: cystathionine beta-lyase [Burkholderiaceae bacterium]|nr:cystathionine beta-lyase [Burkholderiaceae bacterium]
MADKRSPRLDTVLQHAGLAPFDPETGAAPVALPPMRTSTVRFRDLAALDAVSERKRRGERAVGYGRAGMDTHAALEGVFCELEGAQHAFLAPSGMAAITVALLALLDAGDHVLVADCAYAPVRRLDKSVLSRLGIQVEYCRAHPDELADRITPRTRMLYVESPGSLLMEMLDLPALAAVAREHKLVLVTDNTWGSGYIYRPLQLGADVSIVAGTKYVAGHSDVMLGAVVVNDADLAARIEETHYAMGYSVSADDVWLALRGVRTLPLRIRQSAANGLALARWLQDQPQVLRVFHPALPDDPGHELWRRDCTGSNGMLAIELDMDVQAARRFVDALTLFGIGFSWGGFESLVQLVSPELLAPHSYWQGGSNPVVRLHAGLEAADDLIADLARALQKAQQPGEPVID